MGNVVADITMSLDGFITGPDDGPGRGLGQGGECLHNWVMGRPWRYDDEGRRFAPLDADRKVLEQAMASTGAGIIGRRMFDVTGGWGGNPPGGPNARYYVLTHSVPSQWTGPDSPFTFVTDGIHSALAQARAAAGDKNVGIGGGANVIQQYLAARLVDELRLHIAPVLLGTGKRLFDHLSHHRIELDRTGVIESPYATHLFFTIRGSGSQGQRAVGEIAGDRARGRGAGGRVEGQGADHAEQVGDLGRGDE